jgi:hypothetical protein
MQRPEILYSIALAMIPTATMSVIGMKLARALVLAVAAAGAGCGPAGYLRDVTGTAADSVEQAGRVDAARRSPYWWTRSVEYLHKAREEAARANFEAAIRFGQLATAAAQRAKAEATGRGGADEVLPTPEPRP